MRFSLRKLIVIGILVVHTALAPGIQKFEMLDRKELKCLANNIYYEARGEGYEGMLAVGLVTMNRVNHPTKFPGSICAVVFQRGQFSWTITKRNLKTPHELSEYVAYVAMTQSQDYSNFKAIYYHSTKVRPIWSGAVKKSNRIRNHIFYEENV